MKISKPHWDVPNNIKTRIITKCDELNLFSNIKHKSSTNVLIKNKFNLPSLPYWLDQVHSNKVIIDDIDNLFTPADGIISNQNNKILAVYTADCVPVLFTNDKGEYIGILHIGWRGLALGIIDNFISIINENKKDLILWLGPSIKQLHYKVGSDVKNKILSYNNNLKNNFLYLNNNNFLFDLKKSIQDVFIKNDVFNIYSSTLCTYENSEQFYSNRRNKTVGRSVYLIWNTDSIYN